MKKELIKLTLEQADAMEHVDLDKYTVESFEENFIRQIYESTLESKKKLELKE